jgi:hypothetical protein
VDGLRIEDYSVSQPIVNTFQMIMHSEILEYDASHHIMGEIERRSLSRSGELPLNSTRYVM